MATASPSFADQPLSSDSSYGLLDRITVEWALYAGVLGAALFLRLFRLDIAPLSEAEAAQALASLRGSAVPAGGSASLYSLNTILFSIFSASDLLARLVPALIGSLVTLTPILFRDALGRLGALGASIVLAISPIALVGSRTLSGEIVVVGCVLVGLGLLRRYDAEGDRRHLIGAAIAGGVGLASGSAMYTALVAFGAAAAILKLALDQRSGAADRSAWRAAFAPAYRARVVGAGIVAFILAATGGLVRLAGLGAAGDALSTWLTAYGPVSGSPAFGMVQILFVYEGLAVILGAVGLSRALTRSDRFGALLGFAIILSLAIILLQPGRQPIDLLLPTTLLGLLTGYALQPWAEAVLARARLSVDGVILAVGAAVLGFAALQLTAFVRGRFVAVQLGGVAVQPDVALVGLFVVMLVVVGSLLVMMFDMRSTLRAAATLGLIILTLGELGTGWRATQERVGDPRESVWGFTVTPVAVRDLVVEAENTAIRSTGNIFTLPIRVEVDDPVVGWYLRHARLLDSQAAAGVVTTTGLQPSDADYVGSSFTTRLTWDPIGLDFDAWLEWMLFRTTPVEAPQATQSITLWVKR